MNTLLIYNDEFRAQCEKVYNPRNAFCISRDDGMMNGSVNVFNDILINLNSLLALSKDNYSQQDLDHIHYLKEKYKDIV